MCDPATLLIGSTLIGTAGNFVGAAMTAASAKAENDFRQYQIDIQNKQEAENLKLAELNAAQVEQSRQAEARRLRASNIAFLASSGATNYSFFEGADKAADRALRKDIASLRLNLATTTSRIADQIAVNKAQSQFSNLSTNLQTASAYTNAAFRSASLGFDNQYKGQYYSTGNKGP
jgi:hypothetical protein